MNIVQFFQRWWESLVYPDRAGRLVLTRDRLEGFNYFLIGIVSGLYLIYGISMGLFRGTLPGFISGLKLPFLYLLTLLTCFPGFYVLNTRLGPALHPGQCARLLLLAVSSNAIALASYAPVSLFFTVTTSREGYEFLILMHVAVFAVSAFLSIVVIALIFRATARELGKTIRWHFILSWLILYGFVVSQMSWALRPWVGSWAQPYEPFRKVESSFFEAVWKLLQ